MSEFIKIYVMDICNAGMELIKSYINELRSILWRFDTCALWITKEHSNVLKRD